MIVQFTEDTAKVAVRVKAWPIQRYAADWQHIYLVILPGQTDNRCCCQGGSPWILHGCWPLHPTGVDLMNPRQPDFPAFFIQAETLDDKNQLVFDLPERWKQTVPWGRYTGEIHYRPQAIVPVNFRRVVPEGEKPATWEFLDPGCGCNMPKPVPHCPGEPPPHVCILSRFDIDYGPRCSEHIIDRIALEFENA